MWRPFSDKAIPPRWIKANKQPELNPDRVTVTGFINGWCPAYNMVFERAKRASLEHGDQVVFHEINTFDKEVFGEWGISDALFINRKKVNTGPPPSYDKTKKKISKELKKCRNALDSSSEGWVLDLACGSLAFTANIYANFSKRPVVFLDQSLKLLRKGKSRLEKLKGNIIEMDVKHVIKGSLAFGIGVIKNE